MGVPSKRRNDAFNRGSTSGRGTPVDPNRVPGAAAAPLITPHFEEAQAQVNESSENQSGIPTSTTEGNGVSSSAPATPIRDPKHGFYKENGEYETDPAKIASAFVMRPASTRSTGQPFGARHPEYIHPESGVSTENVSLLNENKAKPTVAPAIRVSFKGTNSKRFGLDQQKGNAKYVDGIGYPLEGDIRPTGLTWDGSEKTRGKHEARFLNELVMPAALKIAAIHSRLNDEKKGGPTGVAAVADKEDTNNLQCSFCGTVAKASHRTDTSAEEKTGFLSDHSIMKNGWCKAALMTHNAMHPIKGNLEEL